MRHVLKNRILRIVLTLVLLFVGGVLSIVDKLEKTDNNTTTASLNSSGNQESCQIQLEPSLEPSKECTQSGAHSDAATNTNHCQKHCGHCVTWMPSQQNCLSPNIMTKKVALTSIKSHQNVNLDTGFRPPNL